MKAENYFVLRKTLLQTDSMGGDLPLESYLYVCGQTKRSVCLHEATILPSIQYAQDYLKYCVKDYMFHCIDLATAIQDEIGRAITYHDLATGADE